MKSLFGLLALALALLSSGCSTPQSVAKLQGEGTTEVYNAGYERIWRAAMAAAQTGDMYILRADKVHGFISAKRSLRPETFGENVAIWVRAVGPGKSEVEVVSRQAGPPILFMRNWEKRILTFIEASLAT